ncbi:hypothetical protein [Paenibacillus ehimensis]|uniref:Uncharacterized protein n=1 Tax=Paenibacillus ehimensis TaxID=79264 RepID=A0ABT8VKA6_9BACL|nr:hypothetical protein [Paenibacillus ehimensis]MDO3681420.1 hypothetical protein [Paenibacillus ehimensis]MEC0208269.1 hypothetical protein [Paenibacillus ehimensis]
MNQRKAAEVYPFLETYIARKEEQLAELEQAIKRYEKKRMMEERSYQMMSAFRRLFAGKKPDHHLAVEYIHYVKKPMEQIRVLRLEIEQARAILNESEPNDLVAVSEELSRALDE